MRTRELLGHCWRNLRANGLRSFLTMFGIAWGILSLMLLVAAGAGLQRGYEKANATLGRDLLMLFPGRTSLQEGGLRAGHRVFFRGADVEKIRPECPDVRWMAPEISAPITAASAYNSGVFTTGGSYPGFERFRDETLAQGRFYDAGDLAQGRRVAVLGYDVARHLFSGHAAVGATIWLNHNPYRVIGTLVKKDQNSSYYGPDNQQIFLPFTAMQKDFPLKPPAPLDGASDLLVVPRRAALHARADQEVRRALAPLENFLPTDKQAVSTWDTVLENEMFSRMTGAMQHFLGLTGFLTLALGTLGVMNIMFVAAAERTREIGVHKALGATRRSIQRQFLAEALLLTLVAGAAGMAAGFGICALVNRLPMPMYFAGLIVSAHVATGTAAVLAGLGVIAGWIPARRAAAVDPIRALQYEH